MHQLAPTHRAARRLRHAVVGSFLVLTIGAGVASCGGSSGGGAGSGGGTSHQTGGGSGGAGF